MKLLRSFRWSLALTALLLIITYFLGGAAALFTVVILAVLEVSLSFENAVVNAKILGRLTPFWQRLFLTLGIIIAVFGMRLIFPIVIVSIAGGIGPGAVFDLALNHPQEYAEVLEKAHPAIAAFGGTFLLMLFLDFILQRRDIRWLRRLETIMARLGQLEDISIMITLLVLIVVVQAFGGDHQFGTLISGVLGMLMYLAVNSAIRFFELSRASKPEDTHSPVPQDIRAIARTGLFSFIYLELIDASFSFDGVVGAFAVTNQIVLIAIGLGIGAVFVRSLTIYLVREGTLARYIYLEHGAHYAVGALAILLFITIGYEIPQVVTGLLSVGFITLAFLDSVEYRKRHPEAVHHAHSGARGHHIV
jgi:uncharacterized protein